MTGSVSRRSLLPEGSRLSSSKETGLTLLAGIVALFSLRRSSCS